MRTRTFIGLALLILALMVASTPQLLDPTARGIEQVGEQAGLIKPVEGTAATDSAKKGAKQADPSLTLHGYELQDDGDLRDTVSVDERAANSRGRLSDGTHRVGLPGEAAGAQTDLPYPSPSAMLLDDTGCPVFRPGTDIAALMADPDTKADYAKRVAAADDPTACTASIDAAMKAAASTADAATTTSGMDRERAAILRGDRVEVIIGLRQLQLLDSFFGTDDLATALAELSTSGSTGTADPATASTSGSAASTATSTTKSAATSTKQ